PATGTSTKASERYASTVRPTSAEKRSLLVRLLPSFFQAWAISGMGRIECWTAYRIDFRAGATRTERRHLRASPAWLPRSQSVGKHFPQATQPHTVFQN